MPFRNSLRHFNFRPPCSLALFPATASVLNCRTAHSSRARAALLFPSPNPPQPYFRPGAEWRERAPGNADSKFDISRSPIGSNLETWVCPLPGPLFRAALLPQFPASQFFSKKQVQLARATKRSERVADPLRLFPDLSRCLAVRSFILSPLYLVEFNSLSPPPSLFYPWAV